MRCKLAALRLRSEWEGDAESRRISWAGEAGPLRGKPGGGDVCDPVVGDARSSPDDVDPGTSGAHGSDGGWWRVNAGGAR
jgi:hypothetical protein